MKSKKNLILHAYSEAFISILSYVLIMEVSILIFSIFQFFSLNSDLLNEKNLQYLTETLVAFFPLVLLTSITYQLAKLTNINHNIAIFLSIAIFVSSEALVHSSLGIETVLGIDSPVLVLIIPLLVLKSLDLFSCNSQRYFNINANLNSTIKYIYPSIGIFTIVTGMIFIVEISISHIIFNIDLNITISDNSKLVSMAFIDHIGWFFGIHGANFHNLIFDISFLKNSIYTNLNYKQFYDLFVIYGGSGAGLSLLLALFIAGKDQQSKKISSLALPFVIFNINEILLFGIPIVFNKTLFIPFILVPAINLTLSFIILSLFPIDFVDVSLPWITPAFINVFIATNGSYFAVSLQLFLIFLGTLVYIPFIKRYTESQSISFQQESLVTRLNLKSQLTNKQDFKAYQEKILIIESNKKVEDFISSINMDSLMVYYQPKVNITTNSCTQYEALLRINVGDSVKGPYFLPCIEESGLAPIIDLWVCHQVYKHLCLWSESDFEPKISINLHPDSLASKDLILEISNLFQGKNIDFEIIERGLLDEKSAIENIYILKKNGFSISIDDFGVGFSSFETLCLLPLDSLKIDKSLIDLILSPKGESACRHIASLCQDLGFTCIAEGVESTEQYNKVLQMNIPYIQGFLYSPAIHFDRVIDYSPHES